MVKIAASNVVLDIYYPICETLFLTTFNSLYFIYIHIFVRNSCILLFWMTHSACCIFRPVFGCCAWQTLVEIVRICCKFLAFLSFLQQKCWKWLFPPAFGVRITQTLVEIYNKCSLKINKIKHVWLVLSHFIYCFTHKDFSPFAS